MNRQEFPDNRPYTPPSQPILGPSGQTLPRATRQLQERQEGFSPLLSENTPKRQHRLTKFGIFTLIGLAVIAAAYIGMAYAQRLWPFAPNTPATSTDTTNSLTITNSSSKNTNATLPTQNISNNNTTNSAAKGNTNASANATNENYTLQSTNTNTNTEPLAADGTLTNEELDQISALYKNSATVSAVKYDYTLNVDAKGLSRTKLNLNGHGAIEQEEFLYPDSEMAFAYDLNANGVTAKGSGESKSVDGTAYVKTNGLETNVDAINNFMKSVQNASGTTLSGQWVEINYEDLAQYYANEDLPPIEQSTAAINEYWIYYTSIGTMSDAEYVGKETLHGLETDHYKTVVTQSEMQAALKQAEAVVYDPTMIAIMQMMEYIIANTDDIPVDIWIGPDNLIYRGATKITYHDPKINNDVTAELTVNSLGYNESITVTPPSPTVKADEAMAQLYELMNMLIGSYSGDPASVQAVVQLFL